MSERICVIPWTLVKTAINERLDRQEGHWIGRVNSRKSAYMTASRTGTFVNRTTFHRLPWLLILRGIAGNKRHEAARLFCGDASGRSSD